MSAALHAMIACSENRTPKEQGASFIEAEHQEGKVNTNSGCT